MTGTRCPIRLSRARTGCARWSRTGTTCSAAWRSCRPFGQHILDALGLSLCEDIVAGLDLPRFDNSAMDGYAVRAADVTSASKAAPVSLPVVGEIPAGQPAPHRLSPGTAMKIMTGAQVPDGADTIVPYENTDRGANDVSIVAPSEPGQHIRRIGEDITEGRELFRAGHRIGARDIGVLAGIGRDKVLVRPRPRVVVISTGAELVDPGLALGERAADLRLQLLHAGRYGEGRRGPGVPGRPGR